MRMKKKGFKMKKRTGLRISSVLLGITLFAAAAIPNVNAAPNADGYDPDTEASLTIHKYAVEDDWELDLHADGTEITDNPDIGVDGSGNPIEFDDLAGRILPNVEFTVTLAELKSGAAAGSHSVDDYTAVIGSGAYTTSITTDANGLAIFPDLPHGIYLVTETANSAIAKKAPDFLVSVPMTTPDGDGWIYDVHVYPKNLVETGPEIDKDVTELGNQDDTSFIWDDVTWIVTSEIPAGIAGSIEYIVTDTLDPIFMYQTGSLKISYLNAATATRVSLTSGVHYELVITNSDAAGTDTGFYPATQKLTIELTEAGRQELAKALPADFNPADDELPLLQIEFETYFDTDHITEEDLLANYIGVEIENKAYLDYTNSVGTKYQDDSDEPEVHTGGLRILKVDTKGNIIPTGAQFALFTTEADAKAYYDAENETDRNAALANAVKDPANPANPWIKTTGTDGIAYFLGLEYGDLGDDNDNSSRDYWIVEIKAPNGYNALRTPVKVTVTKDSHTAVEEVRITNATGFTLPLTGDVGTRLFLIFGTLLISVGIAVFTVSRRKRNI